MNKEKLRGLRKLGATAVLASAVLACGNNAEIKPTKAPTTSNPTPEPTVVFSPSIEPSPSMTIAPTDAPTLKPTPEITPIPTPEAISIPLFVTSIIEGEHPKVATKTITNEITEIWKNDDEWRTSLNEIWKFCQKGDPNAGGDPMRDKFGYCRDIISNSIEYYQLNGSKDSNVLKLAKNAYNYTFNKFPTFRKDLNSYLTEVYK